MLVIGSGRRRLPVGATQGVGGTGRSLPTLGLGISATVTFHWRSCAYGILELLATCPTVSSSALRARTHDVPDGALRASSADRGAPRARVLPVNSRWQYLPVEAHFLLHGVRYHP